MVKIPPFDITLYDKGMRRVGWLNDPNTVRAIPTHNDTGAFQVTVSPSNAKLGVLLTEGTRMVSRYRGDFLMSGPIVGRSGASQAGEFTFTVLSDFALLKNILAWPVPANPVTNQNVEYRTITGPAETVVKTVMRENATRLGIPLTIAPDLGRGQRITIQFRFHAPFDRLFPAVELAGLGVEIRQVGDEVGQLVLDVYEPKTWPGKLTDASGIIQSWSWNSTAATATDVVVGGQGEGVNRTLKKYADTARAAALGRKIEVFRDARDTDTGNVLDTRATETFAETEAKTGLTVALSETGIFAYGGENGLRRGDRLTMKLGDYEVTDTLRSAELSWGPGEFKVTPQIGDLSDSPDKEQAKTIRKITAALTNSSKR